MSMLPSEKRVYFSTGRPEWPKLMVLHFRLQDILKASGKGPPLATCNGFLQSKVKKVAGGMRPVVVSVEDGWLYYAELHARYVVPKSKQKLAALMT